jgi:bacterioferritin
MGTVDIFNTIFKKDRGVKTAAIPSVLLPEVEVTKEDLIEGLQGDLILEYTAALQYYQHYAVMRGAAYDNIRQHLKEHAEEEIEHSVVIADRIAQLGGVPDVSLGEIKKSAKSSEMLLQDLEDEHTAVARYKERIVQAMSLGEYGLADELMDILQDEEEHVQDLETSTGDPDEEPGQALSEMRVNTQKPGDIEDSEDYLAQLAQTRELRKEKILEKLAALAKG